MAGADLGQRNAGEVVSGDRLVAGTAVAVVLANVSSAAAVFTPHAALCGERRGVVDRHAGGLPQVADGVVDDIGHGQRAHPARETFPK